MYLHTGVKRLCTKNVTLTHNYKEKAIFLFLQLQVLKNYVQKKGHGDKKVHKKQTYGHNIFDETSAN